MGVIKRGILGGFSGKVGNVLGSSWKGIAYMKSLPLSVANPRSTGQVAQRTAFSGIVAFATLILSGLIKPLWDRWAQGQSGYNAFVRENMGFVINGVIVEPTLVVLSKGKIAKQAITASLMNPSSAEASVTWAYTVGGSFQLADDLAHCLIYNNTKKIAMISSTIARRDANIIYFTGLSGKLTAGDDIHIYLSFKRADGSLVADSAHRLHIWP